MQFSIKGAELELPIYQNTLGKMTGYPFISAWRGEFCFLTTKCTLIATDKIPCCPSLSNARKDRNSEGVMLVIIVVETD